MEEALLWVHFFKAGRQEGGSILAETSSLLVDRIRDGISLELHGPLESDQAAFALGSPIQVKMVGLNTRGGWNTPTPASRGGTAV
jgi:hypothetical protein